MNWNKVDIFECWPEDKLHQDFNGLSMELVSAILDATLSPADALAAKEEIKERVTGYDPVMKLRPKLGASR